MQMERAELLEPITYPMILILIFDSITLTGQFQVILCFHFLTRKFDVSWIIWFHEHVKMIKKRKFIEKSHLKLFFTDYTQQFIKKIFIAPLFLHDWNVCMFFISHCVIPSHFIALVQNQTVHSRKHQFIAMKWQSF